MSLKLVSCIFVLILAVIACEGDSRYFRNPNYRDLYYQNQFFGGLDIPNPKPLPISVPTADLLPRKVEEISKNNDVEKDKTEDGLIADEKAVLEDIYTFTPASGKGRNDPNVLRPLLISLRTELRQMLKTHNENKELLKSILSVNNETLAWEMTQATSFYSLISSLVPSY